MPSVIDICNSALDKVGQTPIMSLTDGNKAAKLCNRHWPLVRDKVLRACGWNFATVRAVLAPSVTAPAWGFGKSFPLPSDLLRLVEVRDHTTDEYQVEGRSILADDSVLYIRYVTRIEDPNVYDSMFCEAAALALAVELCEPMTQSTSKRQDLVRLYDEAITEAKGVDAQENPPARFEEDSWIAVRY